MSLAFPLTTWTQNALTEIFNATVQNAFDRAFDFCFSQSLTVTRNNATISREEYKQFVQGLKFPQQSSSAEFNGLVSFRTNPEGPLETGMVGAFFEAQFKQGEPQGRPFGLNILTSSLIADVQNDPRVVAPITDQDARRILKLTVVDSVREIAF